MSINNVNFIRIVDWSNYDLKMHLNKFIQRILP